jgi:hypothetical protein
MRIEIIEEAKNRYREQQKVDLNRAIVRIFGDMKMLNYFVPVGEFLIEIKGTDIRLRYDTGKQCFIYDIPGCFNKTTSLEVKSMEDLGRCLIIDGK